MPKVHAEKNVKSRRDARGKLSIVPCGTRRALELRPGIEMPGYYQKSLRDYGRPSFTTTAITAGTSYFLRKDSRICMVSAARREFNTGCKHKHSQGGRES